ncbi:hypothetical protein HMH01_11425 [Halovulum dunhuangense]|uniref:Uncharacterized protein n=1 Tax=Halovulum dunhuangense TaxID=1505036 RepID=A0A849L3R8_9RHOB|nr:hypothetical protein [Halovulum dunhuangense]NNU81048.1 hypothetical protein [Halovulum dunhuangense]
MDDKDFEIAKSMNEKLVETSNGLLKSMLLVHCGALVVMIGFISSIITSGQLELSGALESLTHPLIWFCMGILVTLGSMGLAYLTNFALVGDLFSRGAGLDKHSGRWHTMYLVMYISALIGSCASLGIFLGGVLDVRSSILALAAFQHSAP